MFIDAAHINKNHFNKPNISTIVHEINEINAEEDGKKVYISHAGVSFNQAGKITDISYFGYPLTKKGTPDRRQNHCFGLFVKDKDLEKAVRATCRESEKVKKAIDLMKAIKKSKDPVVKIMRDNEYEIEL